jgi:hypothetical protein
MVEEDERPHQARLHRGQRAMHAEITKINRARHDYLLNRVARSRIAEGGIFARKKAHGGALFIFAIEPQTDVTGRPILSWLEAQLCGRAEEQPTAGIPRYPNNVRGADLTFCPAFRTHPFCQILSNIFTSRRNVSDGFWSHGSRAVNDESDLLPIKVELPGWLGAPDGP